MIPFNGRKCGRSTEYLYSQSIFLVAFVIKKRDTTVRLQMVHKTINIKQMFCKGHGGVTGVGQSLWNSNTVTRMAVSSDEAPPIAPRGDQRSDLINCQGNIGQLLVWLPSLACCGNLCVRKIESFTLSSVCEGRFIAMLDRIQMLCRVCGSLYGAVSLRCLTLFGLFRGWAST